MVVIVDCGKEFVGTVSKLFTVANSILLHVRNDTVISSRRFSSGLVGCTPRGPTALQRLAVECNAAKHRLSNRSGYSPLQRVLGIGHRFPAELTSDNVHALDPIYDLAATDSSFEEPRQIREVSFRDRIDHGHRQS